MPPETRIQECIHKDLLQVNRRLEGAMALYYECVACGRLFNDVMDAWTVVPMTRYRADRL